MVEQMTEEPSCEEHSTDIGETGQIFESDSVEDEWPYTDTEVLSVTLDWVGQTGSPSDRQTDELSGLISVVLLTQPNSHSHSGPVVKLLSSPVAPPILTNLRLIGSLS